tara:strand:- start:806 stop:1126 length:321 start_codon:yes stop_codon:yes gene_type:complete
MNSLFNEALEKSKKFYLDKSKFSIVQIKKTFKKNYFIIYGNNEYYFEITTSPKKNFFPYFGEKLFFTDIENWLASISKTQEHHLKIVKKLEEGKTKRDSFKKKFSI